MDLQDLRKQIDEIDHELMVLFQRRMETVEQIAAYKAQHGLPVRDPRREEEKGKALLAQLPPKLQDSAGTLLNCLLTLSREYQHHHIPHSPGPTLRCGLLGRKLSHSYSPAIHARLGPYEYRLYEREPEELETFLRTGNWDGLNVTIPYKKAAAACCDQLSPLAQSLGSVNTLVRRPDGNLYGDNTDAWGFWETIRRMGIECAGKKALILGSGGASVTVQAVLHQLGAQTVVISRSGAHNYQNLDQHPDAAILVNATPVGMYPENEHSPLSLSHFPRLEAVCDLIYNPARTRLLLDAEARGISCTNGLYMLVAQAARSSELFTGKSISREIQESIVAQVGTSMENWILIGMPGCGKSRIGALLARHTGRPFVDADQEVERRMGMSIPAFLSRHGEAAFRALETQVLQDLGKGSGQVIATGGGCVTQGENLPFLRQNGRIIWLQRPLESLTTRGRPLSQTVGLEALYQSRQPMYARFADHIVSNAGSLEDTVRQILEVTAP